MEYRETVSLKDGRTCLLCNGTANDAQRLIDIFMLTHSETDFLLTYPDEKVLVAEEEARYLEERTASPREIEMLAEVENEFVASYERTPKGRARGARTRCPPPLESPFRPFDLDERDWLERPLAQGRTRVAWAISARGKCAETQQATCRRNGFAISLGNHCVYCISKTLFKSSPSDDYSSNYKMPHLETFTKPARAIAPCAALW